MNKQMLFDGLWDLVKESDVDFFEVHVGDEEEGQIYIRFDNLMEVNMSKIYRIRDVEDGSVYLMTLPMILEDLNRDRSDQWQDYDETDWREGLAEFTTYEVIG